MKNVHAPSLKDEINKSLRGFFSVKKNNCDIVDSLFHCLAIRCKSELFLVSLSIEHLANPDFGKAETHFS
jgi:hypothetical protein